MRRNLKKAGCFVAVVAFAVAVLPTVASAQLPGLGSSVPLPVSPGEVIEGVGGAVEGAVGGVGDLLEGALGAGGAGGIVEHADALAAVEADQALPLAELLAIVAAITADQVIDVRLVLFRQTLLYNVKTLARDGVVTDYFFLASTGQLATAELLNAGTGGGG
jgi:hypothetical protein